jgi:hypothetical protein
MLRALTGLIAGTKDPKCLGWCLVLGTPTLTSLAQNKEKRMATLHIQHPVTDFDTWTSAFNRFTGARRNAGVRAERIQRPVDNPKYVVIDLDFDSAAEAIQFRGFLTAQVWSNPTNSPGLAGTPETMILEAAVIDEAA